MPEIEVGRYATPPAGFETGLVLDHFRPLGIGSQFLPCLAISPENRRVAVRDQLEQEKFDWEIFEFKDLHSAQVLVNSVTWIETVTKSNSAGVAFGNAMFSSGSAKSLSVGKELIRTIILRLRVSSFDRPFRDIIFLNSLSARGVNPKSRQETAEMWFGRLRNVIETVAAEQPVAQSPAQSPQVSGSAAQTVWESIKDSTLVADYSDYLDAFRGTAEAMLAARHRRQLDAWAGVDKSDSNQISSFLETAPFPALRQLVQKQLIK